MRDNLIQTSMAISDNTSAKPSTRLRPKMRCAGAEFMEPFLMVNPDVT